MDSADGVYDRSRPWQTSEERLTGEALKYAAVNTPRPPSQTRPLNPPKYGYRTDEIGIEDVISGLKNPLWTPRNYEDSVSGYQGTQFPSLQMW